MSNHDSGHETMILAGDVGATKVRLALFRFEQGALRHVREDKFLASEYRDLASVIRTFLGEKAFSDHQCLDVDAACLGVPGPVRASAVRLTNLPWRINSHELAQELGIENFFLLNDLEANGYGIDELDPSQIFVLNKGDTSQLGHRALIAAGTGLGEGFLIWNGKTHSPIASEGGHADFAPRNDLEIDLLRYLRDQVGSDGHVSWERVCSGRALPKIYSFLRDERKLKESPEVRDRMEAEDPGAVIGELGDSETDELCVRTLEVFVSIYGAEAGNLALKILAHGGVYVGGGIAPKILKTLKKGGFLQAFCEKGRMHDLVAQMPLRIILEPRTALIGAAAYAEAHAAELSGRSLRAASIRLRCE